VLKITEKDSFVEKPIVLNFNSPVQFLNKYFDYLFYKDPKFSLKSWSELANVKFARIKDVLKNKTPIKPGYFEKAQVLLDMCEDQYFYFLSSIRFHNAKTENDKKMFLTLLKHLKEDYYSQDINKKSPLFKNLESAIKKDDNIFKNHLCMTILSMIYLKGFVFEVEDISKMLVYKNTSEEIESAINILKKNKLVSIINGEIIPVINDFFTRSDVKLLPVHNYYEDVSDLAKMAIEEDVTMREFQCFTFPLCREDIIELKNMIKKFRHRVCQLEKPKADYVYQVNFQAFPLAQSINILKDKNLEMGQ
jgi:uncharacterized protein (TIGR02147 family)